jgi:hypothetical protein
MFGENELAYERQASVVSSVNQACIKRPDREKATENGQKDAK